MKMKELFYQNLLKKVKYFQHLYMQLLRKSNLNWETKLGNLFQKRYNNEKKCNRKRCLCSTYSTLLIDWYDNDNVLSLEIGKDSLGYYCDGKIVKGVDKIDIISEEDILSAISIVENDISLSVNKK